MIDAAIGGRQQGETTLAMEVTASNGPGTLVLAGRNMPGVPLWVASAVPVPTCWRLKRWSSALRAIRL